MSANAIMFSQPVLSILNNLPPSRAEINEILAFVFMGSFPPTQEDFDRTPLLVRRQKVLDALEWLKLNHEGYKDLKISQENIDSYVNKDIPVDKEDAISVGSLAVHETAKTHGSKTGKYSFAVHGLRSTDLYDNVNAYPGMFPWLFPYGKGGIGHPSHLKKQGDMSRKVNL
ncbi:hypothetical protein B0H19DRAFT_1214669 [Mycena capillaripes]|nr:hypothetical protein B0H19DRAFT_1214669 [Mycena capillaripes]